MEMGVFLQYKEMNLQGTASVSVTVLAVSTETLIANNNFSTGTHVGTEQASYSGYNVLRMIQNYLSEANIDFEAGIGNWGLGSGWSRVSTSVVGSTTTVTPKNGSYMIKCPPSSNGSYSALTTGIVATIGDSIYLKDGYGAISLIQQE